MDYITNLPEGWLQIFAFIHRLLELQPHSSYTGRQREREVVRGIGSEIERERERGRERGREVEREEGGER